MASKELFHLLRVLDERDTGLGREDVAWAFEPAKRAESEEWVRTYLNPASLLTKEEFAFQDRFGEFTPQINSAASGRPLSDEEFEHAISSLESSTAAIDAQCQIMEAQKRALLDFKARNKTSDDRTARFDSLKPQHKLARDKAQLDLEIGQISSALHERLRSSMAQAENASASLPSKVERLLEKDDRLLDGLQKIVPKLQGGESDSQGLDQVEKLCHAFTILEAKAIRTQIDATYKRNLPASITNGHALTNDQEHQAVRAELAELSSEIDGLITLVAENYYRAPITKRLGSARTESHGEAARWSEYLGSTLHYLASRLESLNEHVQHLHAHRAALAAVSQTLDKTLAAPSTKAQDAPQTPTSKFAQAQKGLKPLRLVQANLPEAPDASAQLLRHLDIRQPDTADVAKLSQNLHNVKLERHDKLTTFASNTDESLTKLLSESLNRADVDARDLLSAVFAHSQYGERRLVDEDVQRELDVLEGRTQTVGEQMRHLDVDGLASDVRKLQRSILTHSR
ncbi:hypothetical protein MBLNU13_g10478t1 [Cladosporium sp. NU13]